MRQLVIGIPLGLLFLCTATTHSAQPWLDLRRSADAAQQSTQADTSQQAAELQEVEEEEYDPYAPLDPHAKGSLPIKPFKKGRKPSAQRRPKEAEPLGLGKLGESKQTIADWTSVAQK